MKELKCFKGEIDPKNLDRNPFGFNHNFANHPSLSIDNLSKLIPEMPKDKILLSKSLNDLKVNFDHALDNDTKKLDMKEVVETIRTSNAYVAVKNPELHPSFKEIYNDLIDDVSQLLMANGTGKAPIAPILWIFMASPNAITPFHFDRTSNFIMQIRGSKELAIFPPRDENVVSKKDTESYIDWSSESPMWEDRLDQYAHKFNFKSGEAAHIPFTSGHYMKNGAEDISITLSFFFHSNETLRWSEAMKLNHRLARLGISTSPVGDSMVVDKFKAGVFPAVDGLYNTMRKLSGK